MKLGGFGNVIGIMHPIRSRNRKGTIVLPEITLIMADDDLSTNEKIVLCAATALTFGDRAFKFDRNTLLISNMTKLDMKTCDRVLEKLEGKGLIAWSGGTRADGTRVFYIDMFMHMGVS